MNIVDKEYAVGHYEFYTTKFYHDLGVAPSRESREIYKRLCSQGDKEEPIVDLNIMNNVLKEDETEGALICDPNYFKFLYKLETRHSERENNINMCLGIMTIDNKGYKSLEKDETKNAMDSLKDIMFNTLRRGDVLSQWNDNQLAFLLYNIKDVNLDHLMDRLKFQFEAENNNAKIDLNIKCKKI